MSTNNHYQFGGTAKQILLVVIFFAAVALITALFLPME
jgi:hypothetical protein